jgi:replicative DNA helicase
MTEDPSRVPPCDLDAEAAVLSAIMLKPDVAAEAFSVAQPHHFFSDANRNIALALFDLYQSNSPIDILTVRAWLADRDKLNRSGGSSYLALILDSVPSVSNVETYAEIVRDKARTRTLIATCSQFAAIGYTHAGSAQEICDQAEAAVGSIARDDASGDVQPLTVSVGKAFQRIQAASKGSAGRTGAPTGFAKLDRLTGGWQATDLIIVAARPGMGKTAFGIGQALATARYGGMVFGEEQTVGGCASLVFSLEMPDEQLAMRLICMEARADLQAVRQGMVGTETWRRLTSTAADLHKVRMHIDMTGGIQVYELRSKVMRAKAKLAKLGQRLSLVVVDYVQKITTNDPRARSRTEYVGSVVRSLKDVARDAEVPIMALAQLNRAIEQGSNRRPMLSDLREAGDLEQEADVVAFLYDPNRKDESQADRDEDDPVKIAEKARKPRDVEFIIEKQRNGPVGTVKMRWTPACTRFDDPAPSYQSLAPQEAAPHWQD